jgi:hypothetical protein
MEKENDDKTEKSLEAPLKETGYGMFVDRTTYIDCLKVFYAYFSTIGSMIFIYGLDPKPLSLYIEENFKADIINIHQSRIFVRPKKQIMMRNILYILKNKMIVDILNDGTTVICFTRMNAKEAKRISEIFIKQFTKKREKEKSYISVITKSFEGLRTVELETKQFPKPYLLLKNNYNDNLLQFHHNLLAKLKKNESGIALLHGQPGGGKSFFIKVLISQLPNKRIIFLPTRFAQNLDNLELTNFLLENPNSLLIVEDADDLIRSREGKEGNSNISMLLNIADGILGDSLKIQFLCTVNTALTNIDPAILRAGRCMGTYLFDKLSVEKSNRLMAELCKGKSLAEPIIFNEPKTLAEIFNTKDAAVIDYKVNNFKPIGFRNGQAGV